MGQANNQSLPAPATHTTHRVKAESRVNQPLVFPPRIVAKGRATGAPGTRRSGWRWQAQSSNRPRRHVRFRPVTDASGAGGLGGASGRLAVGGAVIDRCRVGFSPGPKKRGPAECPPAARRVGADVRPIALILVGAHVSTRGGTMSEAPVLTLLEGAGDRPPAPEGTRPGSSAAQASLAVPVPDPRVRHLRVLIANSSRQVHATHGSLSELALLLRFHALGPRIAGQDVRAVERSDAPLIRTRLVSAGRIPRTLRARPQCVPLKVTFVPDGPWHPRAALDADSAAPTLPRCCSLVAAAPDRSLKPQGAVIARAWNRAWPESRLALELSFGDRVAVVGARAATGLGPAPRVRMRGTVGCAYHRPNATASGRITIVAGSAVEAGRDLTSALDASG